MRFTELPVDNKISYVKNEFAILVKSIFDTPEILKTFITAQQISNAQSKAILNFVNKLNSKTCVCCRRYDPSKVKLLPIDPELEPVLDIARSIAEKKVY